MFKSLFFALFWHLWLCWRASYFISDHLLLKNLLRTLGLAGHCHGHCELPARQLVPRWPTQTLTAWSPMSVYIHSHSDEGCWSGIHQRIVSLHGKLSCLNEWMNDYRLKRLFAQHYIKINSMKLWFTLQRKRNTHKKSLAFVCNIYLLIMTWHLQVTYIDNFLVIHCSTWR